MNKYLSYHELEKENQSLKNRLEEAFSENDKLKDILSFYKIPFYTFYKDINEH